MYVLMWQLQVNLSINFSCSKLSAMPICSGFLALWCCSTFFSLRFGPSSIRSGWYRKTLQSRYIVCLGLIECRLSCKQRPLLKKNNQKKTKKTQHFLWLLFLCNVGARHFNDSCYIRSLFSSALIIDLDNLIFLWKYYFHFVMSALHIKV